MSMNMRSGIVLLLAGISLPLAGQTPAERYEETVQQSAEPLASRPLGTGTVTYDPGSPADVILGATSGTPDLVGNIFDTRNGSPLSPGSITGVSWYAGSSVFSFEPLWLAATPSGSAGVIGYGFTGTTLAFNAVSISAAAVTPPFFVGIDVGGAGSFGSVGLRSASTNAQGFHGARRSPGPGAPSLLPSQNTMLRVSGDIIVPVELLEFETDTE